MQDHALEPVGDACNASLEPALRVLDEMGAVVESASFDQARAIADQVQGVQSLLRAAKAATHLLARAAALRVRAERRLGELLAAMERCGRGEYQRANASLDAFGEQSPPSLGELGIATSRASRATRIAKIPQALFEAHVERAVVEGKPTSVRELVRLQQQLERKEPGKWPERSAAETAQSLEELIASDTRYGCILCDPPWRYQNAASNGAAANHYPTLDIDDIASLAVGELAAENAHLHLWVTSSFLFEAEFIMRSWGFDYRSSFVWTKPQIGTGNYWRSAHELLLLGVRGSAPFADRSLRSWITEPRGAHSAKPEVVRELIERASPPPYLELFARSAAPGWTVWGSEAPKDHDTPSVA